MGSASGSEGKSLFDSLKRINVASKAFDSCNTVVMGSGTCCYSYLMLPGLKLVRQYGSKLMIEFCIVMTAHDIMSIGIPVS